MNKYLVLFLPLLVISCASKVEVQNKVDYKCGSQIVTAEILDDDSMIVKINGVNNVLTRVAAPSGAKYENMATGVSFLNKGDENYLTIKGRSYPMCKEVVR